MNEIDGLDQQARTGLERENRTSEGQESGRVKPFILELVEYRESRRFERALSDPIWGGPVLLIFVCWLHKAYGLLILTIYLGLAYWIRAMLAGTDGLCASISFCLQGLFFFLA